MESMKQVYIFNLKDEFKDMYITSKVEINLQTSTVIKRNFLFQDFIVQKHSHKRIKSILTKMKTNKYYELVGGNK